MDGTAPHTHGISPEHTMCVQPVADVSQTEVTPDVSQTQVSYQPVPGHTRCDQTVPDVIQTEVSVELLPQPPTRQRLQEAAFSALSTQGEKMR